MFRNRRTTTVEETVAFDPETETYTATFDPEFESASMATVLAVAAVSETDPIDLDPLYTVLDSEGLDALFRPTDYGSEPSGVSVTFQFSGYEVTVTSDERIVIRPLTTAG